VEVEIVREELKPVKLSSVLFGKIFGFLGVENFENKKENYLLAHARRLFILILMLNLKSFVINNLLNKELGRASSEMLMLIRKLFK